MNIKFKTNSFSAPVDYFKKFFNGHIPKKILREDIIGIAGTLGKTTTIRAIKEIFDSKVNIVAAQNISDDNFEPRKLIYQTDPKKTKVVLEVELSSPGSVKKLTDKIRPGVGVILNYSPANIVNFGSLKNSFKETQEFVDSFDLNDLLILNYDDLEVRSLSKEREKAVVFFGLDREHSHVWGNNVKIKDGVLTFELNYGVESVEIKTRFLGVYFVYSFLAAATVAINCGFSLFEIKRGIEKLEPEDQKMVSFEGLSKALIIDDTYDMQISSFKENLHTLNLLPARRRFLILGEVVGMGSMSEQIHRDLARSIFQTKIDTVILGGGDCKFIADELLRLGFLPEKVLLNLSNSQMVSEILTSTKKGDIVLVKGAKGNRLGEVVKRITKHD